MANLADVVGTAFGIALAKMNLPVVPTFVLLSGGRCWPATEPARRCRVAEAGAAMAPCALPAAAWHCAFGLCFRGTGRALDANAFCSPHARPPAVGYLIASRREVDSVVLPYLNRARLSYACRGFLESGGRAGGGGGGAGRRQGGASVSGEGGGWVEGVALTARLGQRVGRELGGGTLAWAVWETEASEDHLSVSSVPLRAAGHPPPPLPVAQVIRPHPPARPPACLQTGGRRRARARRGQ